MASAVATFQIVLDDQLLELRRKLLQSYRQQFEPLRKRRGCSRYARRSCHTVECRRINKLHGPRQASSLLFGRRGRKKPKREGKSRYNWTRSLDRINISGSFNFSGDEAIQISNDVGSCLGDTALNAMPKVESRFVFSPSASAKEAHEDANKLGSPSPPSASAKVHEDACKLESPPPNDMIRPSVSASWEEVGGNDAKVSMLHQAGYYFELKDGERENTADDNAVALQHTAQVRSSFVGEVKDELAPRVCSNETSVSQAKYDVRVHCKEAQAADSHDTIEVTNAGFEKDRCFTGSSAKLSLHTVVNIKIKAARWKRKAREALVEANHSASRVTSDIGYCPPFECSEKDIRICGEKAMKIHQVNGASPEQSFSDNPSVPPLKLNDAAGYFQASLNTRGHGSEGIRFLQSDSSKTETGKAATLSKFGVAVPTGIQRTSQVNPKLQEAAWAREDCTDAKCSTLKANFDLMTQKAMETSSRRAAERHAQDEHEWQQLQTMHIKQSAQQESCEQYVKAFLAARALTPEHRLQHFLEKHGFDDVNGKRRKLFSTCYPLHVAVKHHDFDIVKLMLQAKADPSKKNSAGETPVELAQKITKQGPSDPVLAALRNRAC